MTHLFELHIVGRDLPVALMADSPLAAAEKWMELNPEDHITQCRIIGTQARMLNLTAANKSHNGTSPAMLDALDSLMAKG